MPVEHKQKLRDLRALAAEVAELIHQNGDSPIGPGGNLQGRVLVEMRPHGPDPHLQVIEGCARQLVSSINVYLGPRDEPQAR